MKIAVYCAGDSWGQTVNPDGLRKGLGGRETAAVQLASQWALLGHDVTVFAPNDAAMHREAEGGGRVCFIGTEYAMPLLTAFPYDVVLSWEVASLLAIPQIKQWGAVTVCGMQVAHVLEGPDSLMVPDLWVALSPWAARFLGMQLPKGCLVSVQPNCVDPEVYGQARALDYTYPRDNPVRFLYASSPDRGLVHLLRMWPKLRLELPGCELHVVYGARHWAEAQKWNHYVPGQMAVDMLRLITQDGVYDHGKVGQDVLARLHYRSDFLLYPCDPMQPTETGCITVLEAMAAGDVPVISDADCLGEEFAGACEMQPLPFRESEWLQRICALVRDPARVNELRRVGRDFVIPARTWEQVAPDWIEMFEALIQDRAEPLSEERAIVTA
jgi:glycosyltransferase involved in cell wall biosynthesis